MTPIDAILLLVLILAGWVVVYKIGRERGFKAGQLNAITRIKEAYWDKGFKTSDWLVSESEDLNDLPESDNEDEDR